MRMQCPTWCIVSFTMSNMRSVVFVSVLDGNREMDWFSGDKGKKNGENFWPDRNL